MRCCLFGSKYSEFLCTNRRKITDEKVNAVLEKIQSPDIPSSNDLLYAGALVVTERLGIALVQKGFKELWWKRRIEGK